MISGAQVGSTDAAGHMKHTIDFESRAPLFFLLKSIVAERYLVLVLGIH